MAVSYVISVSLAKGCYRHIQISSSASLRVLHKVILSSFNFEDDHAHAFFMDNHVWSPYAAYFSTEMELGDRLTAKYSLKKLNLEKGDKFKYLFDFGDEWVFQCKVLRLTDENVDFPKVIRSVGVPPEQYPDFEGDYADADYDEDDFDEEFTDPSTPAIYEYEQIQSLYQKLPLSKKDLDLLHKYFEAAAHLYGIIPLEVLLKIYNGQNPPISQELFTQVAEIIRHEANDFMLLGAEFFYADEPVSKPLEREIISLAIMMVDPEKYYDLSEAQKDKPYLVLPKKRFLEYADPLFIPTTPHTANMLQFLKKHKQQLDLPPRELLKTIQTMIWMDAPLQFLVDGLDEMGVIFEGEKEVEEFAQCYQDLNNHTRKISNCGHSPLELAECIQAELEKRKSSRFAFSDPNQISLFEKE